MSVIHANDAQFEQQVENSQTPVLVDFFAEWCGPCKQLAPILEQLAPALEGKCTIVKANVEDAPQAAAKYGVSSIPCLFIFKDGKPVANHVGFLPAQALEEFVEENI